MNKSTTILLTIFWCLLSCQSKKEVVDLKMVENGMTKQEVKNLVGKPDSVSADDNEWYYGKNTNVVMFKDESVFLVSLDYQSDGTYEAYKKSFETKNVYEVSNDLTAQKTNIKITFDGKEADVITTSNASLENGTVTISARSEKGGCKFTIVLDKNGNYNGDISFMPEKYTGKDAPFSSSALGKAEKMILNTTKFEKETKLVIQFFYKSEVNLEMASSDEHPIVLEGVLVSQLQ